MQPSSQTEYMFLRDSGFCVANKVASIDSDYSMVRVTILALLLQQFVPKFETVAPNNPKGVLLRLSVLSQPAMKVKRLREPFVLSGGKSTQTLKLLLLTIAQRIIQIIIDRVAKEDPRVRKLYILSIYQWDGSGKYTCLKVA